MLADMLALPSGQHRLPCHACNKGARDTALSVQRHDDHAVYVCHRCGTRGRVNEKGEIRAGRAVKPSVIPEAHETLSSYWRAIWRDLNQISAGTTAHKYLVARGCEVPPSDGDLRCTENLKHPSGYQGPAVVGLITDVLTGEPLSLHRTWINSDGSKADLNPPRLLLSKHRKKGGAIRLFPEVTQGLAIAEGIETALAAAKTFRPVWSAIDAGNLAELPLLDGIESLTIFADHDPAGMRGAADCAARWAEAGREVRMWVSNEGGRDFNDEVINA
ncbi:MAG: toprim domain-containing protein [Burkholderiales bacterium]|nr:toprim domain-containing protein [Burkholderiales bacterium]MDP2398088.1 toprim domain-containing protein [Burkholderiales bacterium]